MSEFAKYATTTPTLSQHLMEHQPAGSKGDFTLLMMAIQTAIKVIERNIRRAGIHGTMGFIGNQTANATGDEQKKLDVIANEAFKIQCLASEKVFVLGSEEEDSAIVADPARRGSYIICFDPLDGSSNIDANVSVGSIWGIWKVKEQFKNVSTVEEATKCIMQPGVDLVSAGYAMYGSATNLVLTVGNQVDCFTLDASIGEFILTQANLRIPPRRAIYSVNEGNERLWHPWFKDYVKHLKYNTRKPYSLRYIGSMVADVHRTILYGGIFCYPSDTKTINGKLRLLYEGAPIALIIEKAGGKAVTGDGRILEVTPTKLHQRTPVFLGSSDEVDLLMTFKLRDDKRVREENAGKLSKL